LTPTRVLAVTREGDHVLAQDTGRAPAELAASGTDAFMGENGEVVIFLRDDKAQDDSRINRILFQDPVYGPRIAPRVDAAQARAAEAAFARRVAEVSSRFAEQAPAPGSREAVLRGIEDIRRGTPNYDLMSPDAANAIRAQLPTLQADLGKLMGKRAAVIGAHTRRTGSGNKPAYSEGNWSLTSPAISTTRSSRSARAAIGADSTVT